MNIRSLLVVAAMALTVAACNGDDAADPSTTPPSSASSTREVPSTTAAPTTDPTTPSTPNSTTTATTTEPTTAPPSTTVSTTAPVGDTDWRSVLETLGLRRQELYRSPDVNRIGEVCTDTGPCAEQLQVQLADMVSKGWHIEGGDPYTVLEAELEDFTGETLETSDIVTIVAIVQRQADGGTIVDSAGAVVAEVDPDTEEGFNPQARVTLARAGTAGDEWRIVDTTRIREVPAG